jgi:hypothetical protein
MRKIIERCPSCGHGELVVSQVHCPECGTEVRGAFTVSRFCRLSEASLEFVEMFVRNRGNLKEMERELKQSYNALRNRLNEVIEEMGYEVAAEEPPEEPARSGAAAGERSSRRQAILLRLSRGEISADDAARELRQL